MRKIWSLVTIIHISDGCQIICWCLLRYMMSFCVQIDLLYHMMVVESHTLNLHCTRKQPCNRKLTCDSIRKVIHVSTQNYTCIYTELKLHIYRELFWYYLFLWASFMVNTLLHVLHKLLIKGAKNTWIKFLKSNRYSLIMKDEVTLSKKQTIFGSWTKFNLPMSSVWTSAMISARTNLLLWYTSAKI